MRFGQRRSDDTGGQLVEWSVLSVLAAAVLVSLTLVLAPASFTEPLESAVCQLFSADEDESDCGGGNSADSDDSGKPPPENVLCANQMLIRTESINGAFRNVRVEQGGQDFVTYQTQPATGEKKAVYSTRSMTSVGLDVSNAQKLKQMQSNKPQWDAFVQGGISGQYNYEYEGKDAWDKASDTRETKRGSGFKRWSAATGGIVTPAVDSAITNVSHGLEWAWSKVTGGDTEKVNAKYERLTPDSVTLDINAKAAVDMSYSADLGSSSGSGPPPGTESGEKKPGASALLEGHLEATHRNSVKIDDEFNRTHEMWFRVDGDMKAKAGFDFGDLLPAEAQAGVSAGGGGRIVQRTKFDSEGNPQRMDFEVRYEGGFGQVLSGNPAAPDMDNKSLEYSEKGRKRAQHTYSLDLTKDENLEAYNKLFDTSTGFAALPAAKHWTDKSELADDAIDFSEKVAENGHQTYSTYDLESEEGVDTSLKKAGTGFGVNSSNTESDLTGFYYRDNAADDPQWQEYEC
ncbi:hypothetical protein FHX37_0798 [Haloactinospora alba]|uniref:Uncharacterized protein n=2 Tax=Haloactinospora alba TaxID=405555 RepID=A0A543NGQ2_9ACTN|nr:hypothetical protein FHX37_0798 [Haloactinospora alba]